LTFIGMHKFKVAEKHCSPVGHQPNPGNY
jgi:hypothetical protein